jgi:flagellar hook-basal body complex protein FliE
MIASFNELPGARQALTPMEAPGIDIRQLQAPGQAQAPQTTGKAGETFGSMLDRFVSGVEGTMQKAGVEQAKVLRGDTSNLHQAMIAMQESGVAFSLMVEVRNKLVEGYQELMRMQV